LFTGSFLQVLWSLQRCSLPIQPSFGSNVVWCVSCKSLSHFWYRFWLQLKLFTWTGIRAHGRCDRSTGCMSTWSHLWYFQRFVFALFSESYFLQVLWEWWLLFVLFYAQCTETNIDTCTPVVGRCCVTIFPSLGFLFWSSPYRLYREEWNRNPWLEKMLRYMTNSLLGISSTPQMLDYITKQLSWFLFIF
jgi:hypothetical protein